MALSCKRIGEEISSGHLCITPQPDLEEGTASVDLRLGRWFSTLRDNRVDVLEVVKRHSVEAGNSQGDGKIGRYYLKETFVPFGGSFILHPGRFVLCSTLEWVSLPPHIAGLVVGKSSWARRGITVESAPGVHPSFSGCLTLEVANAGSAPVELVAGMRICQIFLFECQGNSPVKSGEYAGKRKPYLGDIQVDDFVVELQFDPRRD